MCVFLIPSSYFLATKVVGDVCLISTLHPQIWESSTSSINPGVQNPWGMEHLLKEPQACYQLEGAPRALWRRLLPWILQSPKSPKGMLDLVGVSSLFQSACNSCCIFLIYQSLVSIMKISVWLQSSSRWSVEGTIIYWGSHWFQE